MKIFSAEQVRRWDAYTILNEPVSSTDLMERAAGACFSWLSNNFPTTTGFTILCGTGNNGGDGLAIARMLFAAGYPVSVYILEGRKRTPDFSINVERLIPILVAHYITSAADFPIIQDDIIIIDALFGSGLSSPLEGLAAELVEYINDLQKIIVSIDVPTGLYIDSHTDGGAIVRASVTLSFQTMKLAFMLAENNAFTGTIHLLDIGLHAKFYDEEIALYNTIDRTPVSEIYKPRNQFSHKYTFGHALLYAGSGNMMGAAILCAKACLRTGAGLVTVYAEEGTQAVIQTALPEAITSTEQSLEILSHKKMAIGIGPGLKPTEENNFRLQQIVKTYAGSLVIDATALQILSGNTVMLLQRKTNPAILTPHTGEFDKLFGKAEHDFERLKTALQQSADLACYIILKGHHTLIACPTGEAYFNTNGNAGMATAGSGDVLTGIITGLLAQGYTQKEASILGVHLHGLAGDIAAKKMSQEAMIAGDIIDCLGEAFKKINSVQKDVSTNNL